MEALLNMRVSNPKSNFWGNRPDKSGNYKNLVVKGFFSVIARDGAPKAI
jgi:hypothetical protein